MKLPIEVKVNAPVFKKGKTMENEETKVIDSVKTTTSDFISQHPGYIIGGLAAVFFIGYQMGRNSGMNQLMRFAVSEL